MCGLPVIASTAGNVSVTASDNNFEATGLRWAEKPNASSYQFVPGPVPGITGFAGKSQPLAPLRAVLNEEVGKSGTLSFWFATDRSYRSGIGQPSVQHKLAEVKDSFVVSFDADQSAVTLSVEWGGARSVVGEHHIRIILPEFPGPQWHHFALSWDAKSGRINAYLDGTPYYVPGEKVAPLQMQPGRELLLYPEPFALADVQLSHSPLAEECAAKQVPDAYRGQMDCLLGAQDLGKLELNASKLGKNIYTNALSRQQDIADWKMEGPGLVAFNDGWMEIKSANPNGPAGHLVYWCPTEFPDRMIAEWEFELLSEKGLCILFFSAKGKNGLDLFDPGLSPRNGVFKQYIKGDIDCYHISYYANTPGAPRRVANLRKNHGAYLISNGPVGVSASRPGEIYKAVLIKDGTHVQMAVDGRIIIDYNDDGQRAGPAYDGGRIGFRQMQWTAARYRNFSVRELK